ncbi:MAG: inositol monophosphatase family protein [Gemmatimonadales bacterium]
MLSSLDLLHLARAAAARAAAFVRSVERPTDPAAWHTKSTRDFVTEVDRTAERLIAEVLLAGDPRAAIVGEELSPTVTTAGLVWVVDPLDGTTNFLHAYPAYAISIAAAVDGELHAGVVHHVPRDEVYWAARGGGAWCDDRRLHVSPIASPDHALIGTGYPFKDLGQLAEYQLQFARIAARTTGIRRAGSAALDLADVAAGRFEGFWEQRLSAWDIAAGTLLIREAGGRITDPTGRDLGIEHSAVVAGNPPIHAWLLEMLGVQT